MLRSRRNSTNSVSTTSEDGGVPVSSPRGSNKWSFGKKSPKNGEEMAKHEEELRSLQSQHEEELQSLKSQLSAYEEHDREITKQSSKEHESMQLLVDQMEELTFQLNAKEEALEQAEKAQQTDLVHMEEMDFKLKALESQTPVMEQLSAFAATQKQLEAENQTLREELESLKAMGGNNNNPNTEELKHSVARLQKQLETAQTEKEQAAQEHTAAIAQLQSQHDQDLELLDQENQTLQKQLQEPNNSYTAEQLTALRAEHANEMDEILAQLDLVEAEHAEQLRLLKANDNQEQDVVVHALSTEVTTKTQQLQSLEQSLHECQDQLQQAQQTAADYETRYRQAQPQFEQALEEERRLSLEAADEARQEMIAQAESQFEHANRMYMQLKSEYSASLESRQVLEEELEATQKDMEALQAQVTEQQASFQQQLATLQSDLNKVQEIAVHDKQHFHIELERFQQVHDGLIKQLEEAQEAHRTLEKTLAMLVMEKETVTKENEELKGVCEDTMALLETYEKQGPPPEK